MAVDPQVRALAERLRRLERQALRRKQPSLAHSSIDDGTLLATDGDGTVTMAVGQQVDGTNASTVLVGPVPPTPSPALVTSTPGGMRIYWDGTFVDGAVAPMDFSRVTVHLVSSMMGFDPTDPAAIVGELNSATGSEVSLSAEPGEYLAVLVAWSQAGRFSAYSDPQPAVPGIVSTTDGNPPAGSPPTTLVPLYATLVANWPAQDNADLVGYEVYLDGPDFPATMIGTTYGTSYQISAKPDGSPLARDTTYSAWVRAFDADGFALSTGAPGSGELNYILPADIEQAVLDSIAAAQTDATNALQDAADASQAAADLATEVATVVESFANEYAVGISETVPPATGWSTATPTRNPGEYVWFRTVITRQNGTTSTTNPALLTGNDGATGPQGDSGSQGPQGIPGAPGADGVTTYTWVKYADSAAGAGLSDSPVGKTYIGLAFNKTTATESTTPGDYQWSLIQGAQGPQGQQGIPGTPGADGVTTYTWVKYAPNGAPTAGQLSDSPTGMTHIGFAFNKTTATESTTPGDYQWALIQGPQGPQGSQGIPGTPGADGVTYYTWLKYASSATPAAGDMSDSPVGKTYMGIAVGKTSSTESTTYTDYNWSLIQGPQGSQGIPGTPGADGVTYYTWLKYASSATPAAGDMSDSPTGKTYMGIAVGKTSATESTVYTDYNWSLIQGPQGNQGNAGTSITAVTPYYAQVADNAAAPATPGNVATPAAPWVAVQPTFAAATDLYTTERISYSNGTYSYTPATKSAPYEAALTAWLQAEQALDDAFDANTAAGNALTAANARSRIWYTTSQPPGTNHRVDDVWFDSDDGYTPRVWDGDSWEPKPWGHQSIATMDAGKITVGYLAAARIAAQTIQAIHLEIGAAGDNAILNANMEVIDPIDATLPEGFAHNGWPGGPTTPDAGSVLDTAQFVSGARSIKLETQAGPLHPSVSTTHAIPVVAGEQWYISVNAKASAQAAGFYVRLLDQNGTEVNQTIENRTVTTSWAPYSGIFTIPAGMTHMRLFALNHGQAAGHKVWVDDFTALKNGVSVRIADGSVSARQVGADVIIANDLFSRTAYLGAVKADQIKTGGLNATLAVLGGLTVGPEGEAPRILINPQDGIKILLDEGVIHFPPDGSPAEITAGINAKWIVIEDRLSIRGQGEIQGNVSLANGITKPNVAPGVSPVYQTRTSVLGDGTDENTEDIFRGLVENTSTQFIAAFNYFGIGFRYINKDASWSWGLDPFNTQRNWRNDVGYIHGFTKVGTDYFILWQDGSRLTPGTYDGKFFLTRLGSDFQANGAEISIGDSTVFGGRNPTLVNVEGRVGMIWQSTNKTVWLRLYNTNLSSASVTDKSLATFGNTYNIMDAHYGPHATGGGYRLWIAMDGSHNLAFTPVNRLDPTAAWTRDATHDFNRAANAVVKGIAFDTRAEGNVQDPDVNGVTPPIRNFGDRFVTYNGVGMFSEYGRNPQVEVTRVAYAWYDGVGTTHKTEEGAITSHTRLARTGISIETPPAPDINNTDAGNPDKANQIIVYATNAAAPAKVKQQAILPIGTRTLVLWNQPAVGVDPSLTNEFASAGSTPGILDSTAEDGLGAIIRLSGAGDGRAGPLAWDIKGRALRDQGAERPGAIILWSAPTIPLDCAVAQGQAVPRPKTAGYGGAAGNPSSTSDVYQRLFSEYGTTYGAGDGSTTFNLPDYRDRVLLGIGTYATALTSNEGVAYGTRDLQHTHTIAHVHDATHNHFNTFALGKNTVSKPSGTGAAHTVLLSTTSLDGGITQNSFNTGAASNANSGGQAKTGANSIPFHGIYVLVKL